MFLSNKLTIFIISLAGWLFISGQIQAQDIPLKSCNDSTLDDAVCGTYTVHENRYAKKGRTIPLRVVILKAREPEPGAPPIFHLAGGPGQGAASIARAFNHSWAREHQDLVLIDQRGTGASNPLDCTMAHSDTDLQIYLRQMFRKEVLQECREEMEKKADLRWYTTPVAMDDINEVREALGFEKVVLYGISGGTRSALVFMNRYPQHVSAAVLNGAVPYSFRNPLYHADSAQLAIQKVFEACKESKVCRTAYPDLQKKFEAVLDRLEKEPVSVEISNPFLDSGKMTQVELSRNNFVETVRVFMYSTGRISRLPKLIHQAYNGDYKTFANVAVRRNRALWEQLQLGALMTITCAEDVARIGEDEVESVTGDTFLGDERVRTQMAACEIWPQGYLPKDYKTELKTDVPVLIFSGTMDPVTQPKWGADMKGYFEHARHIVVPGGHGVNGPCLNKIMQQFALTSDLSVPDYACTEEISLPPFVTQN